MAITKYSYLAGVMRVCVDSVDCGCVHGRVYSPCLDGPLVFSDLAYLLLKMEAVFDRRGYPDAYQKKRSFSQTHTVQGLPPMSDEERALEARIAQTQANTGACATFLIRVVTRRNASWQGEIDWLGGRAPEKFESALMLLRMVHAQIFPDEWNDF